MIEIVKGLLFSLLLIAAAIWDIKKREIPNLIPLLLLVVGLIRVKSSDAVFGLILTGLPYFIAEVCIRQPDGFAIGGGDIKLMAACGFVLGVWGGIMQSILSLTLALIAGIILSAVEEKPFKKIKIPLAPCFCVGGIVTYTALMIGAAF